MKPYPHSALIRWIVVIIGFGLSLSIFAIQNPREITQNKLSSLKKDIDSLKADLSKTTLKRQQLMAKLAPVEREISDSIRHLKEAETKLSETTTQISALETHLSELNLQDSEQEQRLIAHIQKRYRMGTHEPLKWLINQNNLNDMNRLMTYYQMIIQSNTALIASIKKTKQDIQLEEQQLTQVFQDNQQLRDTYRKQQHALEQQTKDQEALLKKLNQDNQSKQAQLKNLEANQYQLSKLIQSLTLQEKNNPKFSFTQMRRKLPFPVQVNRQHAKKINQGVLFESKEGEPVYAIYSGKVVFSDWLKGYGLLLIIDHGQGFMTLYAHNQSLFKQKGDRVFLKEPIATTGHSGGMKKMGLYFEIRHYGKAISPLEWLG
jgi:septal ring factor EnvC (AmiA/AmiB activator)